MTDLEQIALLRTIIGWVRNRKDHPIAHWGRILLDESAPASMREVAFEQASLLLRSEGLDVRADTFVAYESIVLPRTES